DMRDVEPPANFPDVARPYRHGGRAGRDVQVGRACEAVQYLLGETGSEPLLVLARRQVLERQDRYGLGMRGGGGYRLLRGTGPKHDDSSSAKDEHQYRCQPEPTWDALPAGLVEPCGRRANSGTR